MKNNWFVYTCLGLSLAVYPLYGAGKCIDGDGYVINVEPDGTPRITIPLFSSASMFPWELGLFLNEELFQDSETGSIGLTIPRVYNSYRGNGGIMYLPTLWTGSFENMPQGIWWDVYSEENSPDKTIYRGFIEWNQGGISGEVQFIKYATPRTLYGMMSIGETQVTLRQGDVSYTCVFIDAGGYFRPSAFEIIGYYAPTGMPVSITDGYGNQTIYEYEQRLLGEGATAYPTGTVSYTTYGYYISKITYPDGDTVTFTYQHEIVAFTEGYGWSIYHYYFLSQVAQGTRTCTINYNEFVSQSWHGFMSGLNDIHLPDGNTLAFTGNFSQSIFSGGAGGNPSQVFLDSGDYTITGGARGTGHTLVVPVKNLVSKVTTSKQAFATPCEWNFEPMTEISRITERNGLIRDTTIYSSRSDVDIDGVGSEPPTSVHKISDYDQSHFLPLREILGGASAVYTRDTSDGKGYQFPAYPVQSFGYIYQNGPGMIPVVPVQEGADTEYFQYLFYLPSFTGLPISVVYPSPGAHFLPGEDEEDHIQTYVDPNTMAQTDQPMRTIEYYPLELVQDGPFKGGPTVAGELFGLVKSEKDTLGNETVYEYYVRNTGGTFNADGHPRQLKKVTNVRVTQKNDPNPDPVPLVEYKYNSQGLVRETCEHTAAGLHITEYLYYGIDTLLSELLATDGRVGKLAITKSGPDGAPEAGKRVHTYKYDADGHIKWEMDPQGFVSESEYYPLGDGAAYAYHGYLHTYTEPYNPAIPNVNDQKRVIHTNTYTTDGTYLKQTVVVACNGVDLSTTTWVYDEDDNLVETQYPDPGVTGHTLTEKWERDPEGHVVKCIDQYNNVTEYEINGLGWVLSSATYAAADAVTKARPLNKVAYKYDVFGNVIAACPQGGTPTYSAYDDSGRKTKESAYPDFGGTDSAKHPSEWFYNSEGLVTKQVDKRGNVVMQDVKYNEYGNLLRYRRPFQNNRGVRDYIQEEFEYDAYGNAVGSKLDMDAADGPDRIATTDLNTFGEAVGTGDNQYDATGVYDSLGRRVAEDIGPVTYCTVYDDQGRVQQTFTTETSVTDASQVEGLAASGHFKSTSTYDGLGRVTSSAAASGARVFYEYDAIGRLTGVQDGRFGQIVFEPATFHADIEYLTSMPPLYGDEGYAIVKTTTPNGQFSARFTDAAGRVVREDVNGKATSYLYMPDGKLQWIVRPAETLVTDLDNGTAVAVKPLVRYEYDNAGRPAKVFRGMLPAGLTLNPDDTSWANECVAGYTYDGNGNLETVRAASPTAGSDPGHIVATNTFNELNQTTISENQAGHKTASDHTKAGETRKVTDALNHPSSFGRTSSGLPEDRLLANGSRVVNSYRTDAPWIDATHDGNTSTITHHRDAVGQMDYTSIQPGNAYVSGTTQRLIMGRDGLDRVTAICENNGSGADVVTTYAYVPDSSIIQSETTTANGVSKTVGYVYDASNRLWQITFPGFGPDGVTTIEYVYNPQGQVEQIKRNASVVVEYGYDNLGNIVSKHAGEDILQSARATDYRGFLYQDETTALGGVKNEVYRRHTDGRLDLIKNLQDHTRSVKYLYDNLYRLIQVKVGTLNAEGTDIPAPVRSESYTYDAMGNIEDAPPVWNILALHDDFNDGIIDVAYDILTGHWWENMRGASLAALGKNLADICLVTGYNDVESFTTTVELAPGNVYAAPLIARMYFAAMEGDYLYAGVRATMVAVAGVDGPPALRRSVTFEIGHNTGDSDAILASDTRIFDASVTTFALDLAIPVGTTRMATLAWHAGTEMGDITAVLGYTSKGCAGFKVTKDDGAFHVSFNDVDIAGKELDIASLNVNPVYQYGSYNGVGCIWDGNGNLVQWNSAYRYDAFNRMVRAGDTMYLYDAQNRRVAKADAAGTITRMYLYHGWSLIAEYDGSGNLIQEYVDGIATDEHICMVNSGGQKYFYVLDPRNGVEKITDATGVVVESYEYTAYGETTIKDAGGDVITTSAVGNIYGFQGRQIDNESGLYYFRNRMFSPLLKRFISMDPLGFGGGSMNLYETFGCDPVNNTDPMGLSVADIQNAARTFGANMAFFDEPEYFLKYSTPWRTLGEGLWSIGSAVVKTQGEFASEVATMESFQDDLKYLDRIDRLIAVVGGTVTPTLAPFPVSTDATNLALAVGGKGSVDVAGALMKVGTAQAVAYGMQYGNPAQYPGLLAAKQIASFENTVALQRLTEINYLYGLLKLTQAAGAVVTLGRAFQSQDALAKSAGYSASIFNLTNIAAGVGAKAMGKFGVISLEHAAAIVAKGTNPIGWAIFIGQLGQWEIQYLNKISNENLTRLGENRVLFMLQQYREQMLDQLRDKITHGLNKSGLINNMTQGATCD
ncbi:MAG: RHS repeat-associated core domain-containing protein [Planctomycetota bacterium]